MDPNQARRHSHMPTAKNPTLQAISDYFNRVVERNQQQAINQRGADPLSPLSQLGVLHQGLKDVANVDAVTDDIIKQGYPSAMNALHTILGPATGLGGKIAGGAFRLSAANPLGKNIASDSFSEALRLLGKGLKKAPAPVAGGLAALPAEAEGSPYLRALEAIRKVRGGWQWGTKGKVYRTKQEAEDSIRTATPKQREFLRKQSERKREAYLARVAKEKEKQYTPEYEQPEGYEEIYNMEAAEQSFIPRKPYRPSVGDKYGDTDWKGDKLAIGALGSIPVTAALPAEAEGGVPDTVLKTLVRLINEGAPTLLRPVGQGIGQRMPKEIAKQQLILDRELHKLGITPEQNENIANIFNRQEHTVEEIVKAVKEVLKGG